MPSALSTSSCVACGVVEEAKIKFEQAIYCQPLGHKSLVSLANLHARNLNVDEAIVTYRRLSQATCDICNTMILTMKDFGHWDEILRLGS